MLISEKCLLHVKVLMLRACIGPVSEGVTNMHPNKDCKLIDLFFILKYDINFTYKER